MLHGPNLRTQLNSLVQSAEDEPYDKHRDNDSDGNLCTGRQIIAFDLFDLRVWDRRGGTSLDFDNNKMVVRNLGDVSLQFFPVAQFELNMRFGAGAKFRNACFDRIAKLGFFVSPGPGNCRRETDQV
jgi:hypothetical protein